MKLSVRASVDFGTQQNYFEMEIAEREHAFREEVHKVGDSIYTQLMLERFIETWTERDRGKKQKMRWEKEPTWGTSRRLAYWARVNYDKIPCYLFEEKSLAERKKEFAISLEPFLKDYGRDVLNSFYRHWTQMENKVNARRLMFESQDFWDTGTRIKKWAERNNTVVR